MATVLLLCGSLMPGQSPRNARQGSEEEVKAAFLFNFLRFVDWPASALKGRSAFTICIAGADPFGTALGKTVEGEKIEGKPIAIRYVHRWEDTCQAIFVGTVDVSQAQLLAGVNPGVLTVGEGTSFLREGGMIAFVLDERRVRFDVNLRSAQRSSVRLRSQLLDVARRVER